MEPNIFVIRLSSLGDIVLTIPVYKNLKAHWPQCRITVLVKPQFVPVLEGNPCVDKVIAFNGLWDALGQIRRGQYTHLLDLHSTMRSFILRRFSGVPNKVRYRKDAIARRLFVGWRLPSPALTKHNVDRYLESLSAWGVPTPQREINVTDYASSSKPIPVPRRVLIVQTAFLGDATLTLPLVRGIKSLPGSPKVAVLTRPDTAEIFRSSQWVDEVIEDDKRGKFSGLGGLLALSKTLRHRNFDAAVVPHRSIRSALAVWLAKVPTRIGFSSSTGRFLFTRTIPFTWGMHDLERNLGLLLPFQNPADTSKRDGADATYLKPSKSAAQMTKRLAEAGIRDGATVIGVHPGSVWPTKRWPADRYARLIGRLTSELGVRVVLVGGKGDFELAESIIKESGASALNWCGKTTLAELIDLMGCLSLFITNDSGPMHVATGSGVPTLALFGPTTRELGFFPYGAHHRVLEVDLACRPCGLHGSKACPEGHFLCMKLISVDQAFQNASEMLREKKGQAKAAAAAR